MARKFGDDRSKDASLSTRIDNEEMDNLYTEDPNQFDDLLIDDGGDPRKPARATRKWGMEAIKGVSKGVLGTVDEELRRNMPNVHVVKTEFSETLDDIKELREDINKQLQPITRDLERIARRVLPKAQRMIPESWYKKIMGKLDEREAERRGETGPSKEEQQTDLIRSELENIFQAQTEMTQHADVEQKKERLIDRALESTRHKADMRALTRIYDSVRSTEIFHRTLHTAYMKKSLELKYKHLFVAQDTHNLLANALSTFEEYFKGIVKNTGLPDAVKLTVSDYARKTRTEKYGMLVSDFLTNARKMVFKKISSSLKDFTSGLGMAATGLDFLPDMLEQRAEEAGGMKGLGIHAASWLAGRFGSEGPVRTIMEKLSPWINAGNGALTNGKDRLYMGMDKLQRSWSVDNNPFKRFIAGFLPNVSGISAVSNDLLRDADKAAVFDKMTRQSITEIIPGYLGKIWHEIAKLRTGDEYTPELKYNIYKRRFTTLGELQDDIYSDPLMFDAKRTQADRINGVIAAVSVGARRKDAKADPMAGLAGHEGTLSKIIANHAIQAWQFDADKVKDFLENADKEPSHYIKVISSGIDPAEFVNTIKLVMNGLTKANGDLDGTLVRSFNDQFIEAAKTTDTLKQRTAFNREVLGMSEEMSDRGETSYVDSSGTRRVIIRGQEGIFKDNGRMNKRFIRNNQSGYNADEIRTGSDVTDAWQYKDLEKQSEDTDKVAAIIASKKSAMSDSAVGRAASAILDFFSKSDEELLPKIEAIPIIGKKTDAIKKIVEARKKKLLEQRDKLEQDELADLEDVNDWGALSGSAAERTTVTAAHKRKSSLRRRVGRTPVTVDAGIGTITSGSILPVLMPNGRYKDPMTGRYMKKADALAILSEASKSSSTPTSSAGPAPSSPTPEPEGVTLSVNMGEDKGPLLGRMWNAIKSKFSSAYDNLPATQEEVDAQVARFEQSIKDAYDKSPKDLKSAQKQFIGFMSALAAKNPELAKRAQSVYTQIVSSRASQAATAYSQYVYGKLSPHVNKVVAYGSKKWEAVKKSVGGMYDSAKEKVLGNVDEYLKDKSISRETLLKAWRGDPEARALVDKEYPGLINQISEDVKAKAAQGAASLGSSISSGMKSAAEYAGKGYAASAGFMSGLKSKFMAGAGIEDTPEPKGEIEVATPKGLMPMLGEWRDSQERALATIIDGLSATMGTIAESAPKGSYISIKEFDRNRYGFFGKGGSIIGGAIKGVGKAALWTGKTAAKLYAGTLGLYVKAAGAAIGGVAHVGKSIASGIGITPFRDLYVTGEKSPRISAKKQGHGVVYKDNGKLAKSTKEIITRGVPVIDPETGNELISEEDIKTGLWAKGGVAGEIIKAPFTLAGKFLDMEHTLLKGYVGIATIAAKGLFGSGGPEKYVDVYRKGEVDGKPLLTRRQQKKGVVFKNGERVERSSDIHEPVYEVMPDGSMQILITEEDIEHGLVDVNNKPLGSGQGGRGIIGAALGLGNTIAKGLFGSGMKILGGAFSVGAAFWKGMFGWLFNGGAAIGRGLARLGARLFGFETSDGFGRRAFDGVTDRLDTIIDIMKSGRKPAKEKKDPGPMGKSITLHSVLNKHKGEASSKVESKDKSLLGGLLGGKGKDKGDGKGEKDETSLVAKIAGAAAGGFGLWKAGKWIKNKVTGKSGEPAKGSGSKPSEAKPVTTEAKPGAKDLGKPEGIKPKGEAPKPNVNTDRFMPEKITMKDGSIRYKYPKGHPKAGQFMKTADAEAMISKMRSTVPKVKIKPGKAGNVLKEASKTEPWVTSKGYVKNPKTGKPYTRAEAIAEGLADASGKPTKLATGLKWVKTAAEAGALAALAYDYSQTDAKADAAEGLMRKVKELKGEEVTPEDVLAARDVGSGGIVESGLDFYTRGMYSLGSEVDTVGVGGLVNAFNPWASKEENDYYATLRARRQYADIQERARWYKENNSELYTFADTTRDYWEKSMRESAENDNSVWGFTKYVFGNAAIATGDKLQSTLNLLESGLDRVGSQAVDEKGNDDRAKEDFKFRKQFTIPNERKAFLLIDNFIKKEAKVKLPKEYYYKEDVYDKKDLYPELLKDDYEFMSSSTDKVMFGARKNSAYLGNIKHKHAGEPRPGAIPLHKAGEVIVEKIRALAAKFSGKDIQDKEWINDKEFKEKFATYLRTAFSEYNKTGEVSSADRLIWKINDSTYASFDISDLNKEDLDIIAKRKENLKYIKNIKLTGFIDDKDPRFAGQLAIHYSNGFPSPADFYLYSDFDNIKHTWWAGIGDTQTGKNLHVVETVPGRIGWYQNHQLYEAVEEVITRVRSKLIRAFENSPEYLRDQAAKKEAEEKQKRDDYRKANAGKALAARMETLTSDSTAMSFTPDQQKRLDELDAKVDKDPLSLTDAETAEWLDLTSKKPTKDMSKLKAKYKKHSVSDQMKELERLSYLKGKDWTELPESFGNDPLVDQFVGDYLETFKTLENFVIGTQSKVGGSIRGKRLQDVFEAFKKKHPELNNKQLWDIRNKALKIIQEYSDKNFKENVPDDSQVEERLAQARTGVDGSLITKPMADRSEDVVTPQALAAQRNAVARESSAAIATMARRLEESSVSSSSQAQVAQQNLGVKLDRIASATETSNLMWKKLVDPYGLKVSGVPELVALTATRPKGGNVTNNITNVTQSTEKGIDVRAVQA